MNQILKWIDGSYFSCFLVITNHDAAMKWQVQAITSKKPD